MLSVLLFWVLIQLFALAALPLTWRLFAFLPDRGYALAKPLGLLLVSYLLWLGASFGFLRNSVGGIVLAWLLVAGLSVWLLWQNGGLQALRAWARENLRLILVTEVLFLLALAGWAYFRAFDPAIAGTEKPMELAFLNGVLRSDRFPPMDPWLSGYSISYYYFGYVMLAVLTRLSGLSSAVTFNIGLALWFALGAAAAFSVGVNLASLANRSPAAGARPPGARALAIGVLAAVFVVLLGNQEGIIEFAYHNRVVAAPTVQTLDIKGITDNPPSGRWYVGDFWWWWHASRVIHDVDLAGNSVEVIDEFPNFSFILGDMHPHVLGLPFAILAVGLALNLFLAAAGSRGDDMAGNAGHPEQKPGRAQAEAKGDNLIRLAFVRLREVFPLGTLGFGIYALVLGGLSFLNTWDFPIYLGLVVLALGAGLSVAQQQLESRSVGRALASGFILGLAGIVLYIPFYLGFQSQAGGLLPNLLFPTRLPQFVVMFAPFLVAVLALFLLETVRLGVGEVARRALGWLPWTIGLPLLLVLGLLVLARVTPQGQAFVADLLRNPAVAAQVGDNSVADLLGLVARIRLGQPWTFLFLALLIAWVLALLQVKLAAAPARAAAGPGDPVLVFVLLMAGVALLLTFAPEFVYLKDNFGTRMNTVFKFYYQGWILLALGSAYVVAYLLQSREVTALRVPALAVLALLVVSGLYYPLAACYSKAGLFAHEPTLDGLAYLQQGNPGDYNAIQWVLANAGGARVVLEASGSSYDTSGAGRFSMSTGIPTLLGWDGHEAQWRGAAYGALVQGRPEAIEGIYRTAAATQLDGLLEQWDVDYVVVGQLERSKYRLQPASLARLDRTMDLVYDQDGVRIYRRRGAVEATQAAAPPAQAGLTGVTR